MAHLVLHTYYNIFSKTELTLKQRLAQPSTLSDISGISELSGISVDGDTVTVGDVNGTTSLAIRVTPLTLTKKASVRM